MTIAVIASMNPKGDMTAILCARGGEPEILGAFLKTHYTKRAQTRALLGLGDRVDNVPQPHFIPNADRGDPARTGSAAEIADWAADRGASFIYVMSAAGDWFFQRIGDWPHHVALRPIE